jgi:hypothetical protein
MPLTPRTATEKAENRARAAVALAEGIALLEQQQRAEHSDGAEQLDCIDRAVAALERECPCHADMQV